MQINGEAIYSTRPWKVYGEGPHTIKSGSFQGKSIAALGSDDIRFTRNKAGTVVYAICLGWPKNGFFIRSLGGASAAKPGKIDRVELLGTDKQLSWRQTDDALRVERPVYTRPTTSRSPSRSPSPEPGSGSAVLPRPSVRIASAVIRRKRDGQQVSRIEAPEASGHREDGQGSRQPPAVPEAAEPLLEFRAHDVGLPPSLSIWRS